MNDVGTMNNYRTNKQTIRVTVKLGTKCEAPEGTIPPFLYLFEKYSKVVEITHCCVQTDLFKRVRQTVPPFLYFVWRVPSNPKSLPNPLWGQDV